MSAFIAFLRLGRPLFLGGGFIIYALGAGAAALAGHALDWRLYALGQAVVTAFQLMTHYANDYFDYEADRANLTPTQWSGGSRVLPDGELPPYVALVAALVLAALGIVASVALGSATSGTIAGIALVMGGLAWAYSAPPVRLCASGLGELDTAVVVTGLVPLLGFVVQAPDLIGARLVALVAVPPFLLQIAMLLAIEFPDAAGDAATGKRTLVVRLGAARAARLQAALTALAFLWLPAAVALGLPGRIALFAALPAPIAAWRIIRIAEHRDPKAYERLTTFAVALLVLTSAAELVAVISLA